MNVHNQSRLNINGVFFFKRTVIGFLPGDRDGWSLQLEIKKKTYMSSCKLYLQEDSIWMACGCVLYVLKRFKLF